MTRRILREALIFGTIGVVATGLHYGIYWCLLGVMRPGWAYTLGYGVSLVVNFLLNASLTFRAQARQGAAWAFWGRMRLIMAFIFRCSAFFFGWAYPKSGHRCRCLP